MRGTRSPSRRQSRSTRVGFTRQPSARRRAVMRREPERPKRRARAMIRAIRAGSSVATRAGCRCGRRGGARTRQARRSETTSAVRAGVTAWRRRAGRSNFPTRPPCGWRCPAPGRPPASSAARSRAPAPCGASPGPLAGRRPPAASGSTAACDPEPPGARAHVLPLGSGDLRLPQRADDRLRRVPLPRHADSLLTGPNPRTGSGPVLGGQVRGSPKFQR